jgi:hypothetical protein
MPTPFLNSTVSERSTDQASSVLVRSASPHLRGCPSASIAFTVRVTVAALDFACARFAGGRAILDVAVMDAPLPSSAGRCFQPPFASALNRARKERPNARADAAVRYPSATSPEVEVTVTPATFVRFEWWVRCTETLAAAASVRVTLNSSRSRPCPR